MFEFIYYFCNRGRENLRELQKTDFTVSVDSTGREYVTVKERQTKNHRGDDLQDMSSKQGRMYDKPGDPRCPVLSFKKYIGKLHPENPNFWQRPMKRKYEEKESWYENTAVGKNILYSFMANLSKEAILSKIYTNHCIRATSITTLDHEGVEARHIMGLSGHRCESSIKSYSSKLSEAKTREMSEILCKNISATSKTLSNSENAVPSENVSTDFLDSDLIN
ncbi:uncharacterized protein LOC134260397 [Saccostrea cucullata]|uniref:uncharacterized protein LOC134260397 n=1 Tax=Saccostrea cuccullata TaxID=36930 RepID=UPI002ED03FB8